MKKNSWQEALKEKNRRLEVENYELRQRIDALVKQNTQYEKMLSGPPTLMIACEKIAEAAVQLTCSANSMIEKVQRRLL